MKVGDIILWSFTLVLFFIILYVPFTLFYPFKESCGPSEEVSEPMVKAITNELNKKNNFLKRIKLEEFKNLPYKLVDCEEEMLTRGYTSHKLVDSKKENIIQGITSQVCYFKHKTDKYAVKLEINLKSKKADETYFIPCSTLFVSIRKNESDKSDLSWREYPIACDRQKSIGDEEGDYIWELHPRLSSIRLTSQSTGLCGHSFNLQFN